MSSPKNVLLESLKRFHDPELVGSILLIYVLTSVSRTVNIPHQLLHGLKVIMPPTEEAMQRLRPDAKGSRPVDLKQRGKEGKEPDAYDKMNALSLVRLEVSKGTLGSHVFFPYYDSMVTWSLVALGNFLISEGSRCAIPSKRPMGWAALTLSAALSRAVWCNVRLVGLLGWEHDHGKFAVVSGFCGLFAAAACAAMPPRGFFLFDLWGAASGLHRWSGKMLGIVWSRDGGEDHLRSGLSEDDFAALFLPGIAVLAAGVTAAAALPSIRFAQFYHRALRKGSGVPLSVRCLFVADLVLPWLASVAWVRSMFVPRPWLFGSELEGGDEGKGVGLDVGLHLWVTAAAAVVRLALAKTQLQMFLNGAKEVVLQELREKKVNGNAVRTKFEARFQYLVIAAAQYAAPALTVLLALAVFVHRPGFEGQRLLSPTMIGMHPMDGVRVASGGSSSVEGNSVAWGAEDLAREFRHGWEGHSFGVCDGVRWAVGMKPWAQAFRESLGSTPSSGLGEDGKAHGRDKGEETVHEREAEVGRAACEESDGIVREHDSKLDGCVDASIAQVGEGAGVREIEGSEDPSAQTCEETPRELKQGEGTNGHVQAEQPEGESEASRRNEGKVVESSLVTLLRLVNVPEVVWSGVTGFVAWWACLCWAITYAIGVVFWRLFPEEEAVEERTPLDRTTKATRDREGRGKGKAKVKGGAGGSKVA